MNPHVLDSIQGDLFGILIAVVIILALVAVNTGRHWHDNH